MLNRFKHIVLLALLCLPFGVKAQEGNLQDSIFHKQYTAARAYEDLLKYREAFEAYRHCLEIDTANIDILNALARTATNLGKASEAEQYFRKVLATDNTNFYANYQLARLYYQIGEYEMSLEQYQFLLDQDPHNAALLRNEGDCYTRLDLPSAALTSYFQAFRLNRENAGLASTLINSLLRIGGDLAAEALAVCDTALHYNPENVLLRQNKAMALYLNKRYAEADTLYSDLMAKGDSSYLTLKYAGASRYYAGQPMRAIEPLEVAYGDDTTSVEVCLLLGSALGKTYDRRRAYVLLDKAEEGMQPNPFYVSQLKFFRAETYQRDGRNLEASRLYYQLWQENNKRLDLLWQISNIAAFTGGNDAQSDTQHQRALFAHILYAKEYLKTGEDPKQIFFLRRLLEPFYEDAFFRSLTDLPMLAPDGKKSTISVIDLRAILNRIPESTP